MIQRNSVTNFRLSLCSPIISGLLALAVIALASCQVNSIQHPVFRDLPFDVDFVETGPPLSVNGTEVEVEMLQLIALSKQPQVLAYFRERFGSPDERDFWQESFDGQVPENRLRRLTLIEAVESKLIQLIAGELGLRESASFEYVKERWQEENERRTQALQSGEDLYGPPQYSLFEFFRQDMKSLSLAVRQRLEEKEVLRAIEEESWLPAGPESRIERLRRTLKIYLQRKLEEASVKINRSRFLTFDLAEATSH